MNIDSKREHCSRQGLVFTFSGKVRGVTNASEGARARVRAELTTEIVDAARTELAEVGAAALSLRSVARRLGMVPSALYRYFPSRDSLLTALIVDAYEAVGAAAASGASSAGGRGTLDRWLSVARSVRAWAAEHPERWALIYGSPVPGYAAPEATVDAALRITEVVSGLVRESAGRLPKGVFPDAGHLEAVVEPMRQALMPGRPAATVVGALMAWTSLIGMVSLERFGHYKGATTDFDPVFAYAMEVAGRLSGLS
jgi:AcrR family transcriptional regulator